MNCVPNQKHLVQQLSALLGVLVVCAFLTPACVFSLTQVSQSSSSASKTKESPVKSIIKNWQNPVPEAQKMVQEDRLYKEVLDELRPWTLSAPDNAPELVGGMSLVVDCLQNLGQIAGRDDYLEEMIQKHRRQVELLKAVANVYQSWPNYGTIIDNRFIRGSYGGTQVYISKRDRVRSLQLMRQAAEVVEAQLKSGAINPEEATKFYQEFSGYFPSGSGWTLQILTDIDQLPDYETDRNHSGNQNTAPVDEQGNPVYYKLVESFEAAQSDGERWRFLVEKGSTGSDVAKIWGLGTRASFLASQFGVSTLAEYNFFFRNDQTPDPTENPQDGIWSLHTLGENETIAKLATGIKRFDLPDDQNYLLLWKEAQSVGTINDKIRFGELIGQEYLNRRQYTKAAAEYKNLLTLIKKLDPEDHRKQQYEQIVKNWGQFEPVGSQVSGNDVTLSYLFRNGKKVTLTAQQIDISAMIKDIKAYLTRLTEMKNPQSDSNKLYIENIGYRLLTQDDREAKKYLRPEITRWDVALSPLADHFDARQSIKLPPSKPGAWLVKAMMEDGNTDALVVWVNDTAIVEKPMGDSFLYYLANAMTGAPIANLPVEFFGFGSQREDQIPPAGNRRGATPGPTPANTNTYRMIVESVTETTNDNGLITFNKERINNQNAQWLISTLPQKGSEPERVAWLGMKNFWFQPATENRFSQTKAYFISDRPVYRPEQKMEFKFWVGTAQYDLPETSAWAEKSVHYLIRDPQGTIVAEKDVVLDRFGGIADSFEIEKEAKLGHWQIELSEANQNHHLGNGSFRVEEYKKPEFEVTIESPKEPVALGDTFKAKVKANYYFGAPVTHGTVKYTVTRTKDDSAWYPNRPWDWFYGNGYWWFSYDYPQYPGWSRWGCPRPRKPWMPWFGSTPPEVIAEMELPIGEEGSVDIEIDSALAKAIYPNDNQKYQITAEVVDQSRRTISASSSVLVSSTPFKVYVWGNRGYYQGDQQIDATIQARRIDGKPVLGKGVATLYRIDYPAADNSTDDWQVTETPVETQEVTLNAAGTVQIKYVAGAPGQYRLTCQVDDEAGHKIEGGWLFTVRPAKSTAVKPNDAKPNNAPAKSEDSAFRFAKLELVPELPEYQPGETVKLTINSDQNNATVLLFVRAENSLCKEPQVVRLAGKSAQVEFKVEKGDMPNFFIEALLVSQGHIYTDQKEIAVPPEKKILNVEVLPSQESYLPGAKADATIRVTDHNGNPIVGQVVVSIYDKSIDYIAGGPSMNNIKEFFWKWQRSNHPQSFHNLEKISGNITPQGQQPWQPLGIFGGVIPNVPGQTETRKSRSKNTMLGMSMGGGGGRSMPVPMAAPAGRMNMMGEAPVMADSLMMKSESAPQSVAAYHAGVEISFTTEAMDQDAPFVEATVRENFADTAYWAATLLTDNEGTAKISLEMPENLTTWKIMVWSCSPGLRVGEGSTEVITKKNLIIRMQRPRFLVQGDIVTLSANVHNYLETQKQVQVSLELPNDSANDTGDSNAADSSASYLTFMENNATQTVDVAPKGEARIDWVLQANQIGNAVLVMKALTDEESDAMKETLPIYVHGMLKQEARSGMIAPRSESDKATNATVSQTFEMIVPKERRPEESKLTVRVSPTLAGAILEALPYLADYPYGCTEQTLNRFLPTVLLQKTLLDLGIDLESIALSQANLNAQELGDAKTRSQQWNRLKGRHAKEDVNPVFSTEEVQKMSRAGIERLTQMQCSDGGWGWFSGFGERSTPQLTALVLRGLILAQNADVAIDKNVILQGKNWLIRYQQNEATKIVRGKIWSDEEKKKKSDQWKTGADNTDAFVFQVLCEAGLTADNGFSKEIAPAFAAEDQTKLLGDDTIRQFQQSAVTMSFMKESLWESRSKLSLLSLSLYGLGLAAESLELNRDRIAGCVRTLSQFLREDDENQTAWLNLAATSNWCWWFWYGSEFETQAAYLKLLLQLDPKNDIAPRLVKYLLNNRKNGTYWNSTRDTAYCLEAFTAYLQTTKELAPNTVVSIAVNGKVEKEVAITPENLFVIDNTLELFGEALTDGSHQITISQTGVGPLYYNAYLENFTLENPILKTGLEVKVERRYYLLEKDTDATAIVAGSRNQAVSQRVEKYKKTPIEDLAQLKSGQLVEVELIIESKNDYESILIEDYKAAGFEAVETRSGYNGNSLGAYVEYRDEKVCFFAGQLRQGRHSISYRLRAEQPGNYSALPAVIWGMYAPELKGNSDEDKFKIVD